MGCKQQKVLDCSDCSSCEFGYGYLVQHSFSYHGVTTISGSVIVRFFFLCDADLLGMVSSLTSALAAVSHGHSRLSIQVLLVAIDRTSVRTSVNRTTSSTTHNSNRTSITVSMLWVLHSCSYKILKGFLVFVSECASILVCDTVTGCKVCDSWKCPEPLS